MTTVYIEDGKLAVDTCISTGSWNNIQSKVFKGPKRSWLAVGAGHYDRIKHCSELYSGKVSEEDAEKVYLEGAPYVNFFFAVPGKLTKYVTYKYHRKDKAYYLISATNVNTGLCRAGSGGGFFCGARWAGASMQRAIEITSDRDTATNDKFEFYDLNTLKRISIKEFK